MASWATATSRRSFENFAGERVAAVSAGEYHSIAITAGGAFLTWGEGDAGCLGHGEDLSNQLLPKKIERGRRGGEQEGVGAGGALPA